MNPDEVVKTKVAAIVRRALRDSDFTVPEDVVDDFAYADEVDNVAAAVVGLLHADGLIAYPDAPGTVKLDPTDAVDVALSLARDVLREPVGDVRATIAVYEDGTVNYETGNVVTLKEG